MDITNENRKEILIKIYSEEYFSMLDYKGFSSNRKIKNMGSLIQQMETEYKTCTSKRIKNKENAVGSLKNELYKFTKISDWKILENNFSELDVDDFMNRMIDLIAELDFESSSRLNVDDFKETIETLIKRNNTKLYTMPIAQLYDDIIVKGRTKDAIKNNINDDPYEEVNKDLEFKKKYYIHVGQTNTGKTYSGIQALIKAKTGVYLSPLRLLALEKQEELNKEGCICSMITGEEESIIPFATHMSSTVELLDLNKEYDVAVIDECQMINDENRGQFWTKAILEVKAHEIYLCTAPEALDLLKKILDEISADYEVCNHIRNTPLILQKDIYKLPSDIQKGDALVVFSRKAALSLASELTRKGYRVSTIYGALPYSTRKMQVEKFISGESDVVVSTDAIGMGLNLPIKRIVFAQNEKFDGCCVRELNNYEIRQIAGRAGRFGIFSEGYVATTIPEMLPTLEEALTEDIEPIDIAYLGFPKDIINIDNNDLFYTIKMWKEIPVNLPFKKISVERILERKIYIEPFGKKLSKPEIYTLLRIPFNEKMESLGELFVTYIKYYIRVRNSEDFMYEELPFPNLTGNSLADYEEYYSKLDLYYSFSKNFNFCIDEDRLISEKQKTSEKINELLLKIRANRTCRKCGRILSWNYKYNICDKCYFSFEEDFE